MPQNPTSRICPFDAREACQTAESNFFPPGFRHDRGNDASCPGPAHDRALGTGAIPAGSLTLRPGDIAMRLCAALLSLVLLAAAPAVPAARAGNAAAREGPVPADRLSGRDGAAGHRLDRQSAAAELRAAAGAARARGDGRAVGLDRRRCSAAASRSRPRWRPPTTAPRCSFASTCRRTRRWARRTSPSPPRARSTEVTLPIAVTLAKDLPAKLTVKPQLPSLRGNVEVELRVPAQRQERQRPQPRGRLSARRRRRTSRRPSPSSTAARS